MTDSDRIEVLMLGWEYPPHISGGLGTACEGLTKALAPLGVSIDFVVPHIYGQEHAGHMRLASPELVTSGLDPLAFPLNYAGVTSGMVAAPPPPAPTPHTNGGGRARAPLPPGLSFVASDATQVAQQASNGESQPGAGRSEADVIRIPAYLAPYLRPAQYAALVRAMESGDREALRTLLGTAGRVQEALDASSDGNEPAAPPARSGGHYGEDLFDEVMRYADRVVSWAHGRRPRLVHAHDWMTFPAATRVAQAHGIPLVVHVHSLEQDRSGGGANPTIVAIEGEGMRAATRVITVSHYTARMIHELHGIPLDNIDVVHNGAYTRPTVSAYRAEAGDDRPMVLFLGRITYQKGPDYFVEAAAKVLEQVPDARFVMAGNGDMLPRLQERVRELGIEGAFEFPGFVRGREVERLFSTADAYVMPSVSEPFGISALEAMSYETPVVLSKQSGASEVLHHALKVDFWDVNRLAAQIVAILRYPELRSSIVDMAREEVRRVHWEAAATKVVQTYARVLGES